MTRLTPERQRQVAAWVNKCVHAAREFTLVANTFKVMLDVCKTTTEFAVTWPAAVKVLPRDSKQLDVVKLLKRFDDLPTRNLSSYKLIFPTDIISDDRDTTLIPDLMRASEELIARAFMLNDEYKPKPANGLEMVSIPKIEAFETDPWYFRAKYL